MQSLKKRTANCGVTSISREELFRRAEELMPILAGRFNH
jgi:hypothetical protein